MRSANNRTTAKRGPPVAAAWLPDHTPPSASRGSKPRPDRLADIAHGKLEELIVTLELAPGSLWSEPDLAQAARWMRRCVEQPLLRQRVGAAGALTIRERFSSAAAGRAMSERLSEISSELLALR